MWAQSRGWRMLQTCHHCGLSAQKKNESDHPTRRLLNHKPKDFRWIIIIIIIIISSSIIIILSATIIMNNTLFAYMCISFNLNLYKTYIIMVIIQPPHCHQATQIHFEGSPLKGSGSELPPFGSIEGWLLSKVSAGKIKKKHTFHTLIWRI